LHNLLFTTAQSSFVNEGNAGKLSKLQSYKTIPTFLTSQRASLPAFAKCSTGLMIHCMAPKIQAVIEGA